MQVDIPGYRIIKTLGKGGMARVYLAIQESFEREVALKIMSPHLSADEGFGERFLREARIVSRLVHPNIVTVYDVGVHQGNYFLSMEYVPGQELAFKHPQMSLAQCLNAIKDVAKALDYAGKKGYVHRDVKPENIMLHDDDDRAVLMDFGIARATDIASGMTQTGMAIGTPHYMSPEQAKGQPVDSRADIYSLGVVLFLLLTGRLPYEAESAVVVGIMHVSDDIPQLPDQLQTFQPIIERVLAKKPDERYQMAAELIADLEALPAEAIELAEATRQRLLAEEEAANQTLTPPWVALADGQSLAGDDSEVGFVANPGDATVISTSLPGIPVPSPAAALSLHAEDRVIQHKTEKTAGFGWWIAGLAGICLIVGIYFKNDLLALRNPLPESMGLPPDNQNTIDPLNTPALAASSSEVSVSSDAGTGEPNTTRVVDNEFQAVEFVERNLPPVVADTNTTTHSDTPTDDESAVAEVEEEPPEDTMGMDLAEGPVEEASAEAERQAAEDARLQEQLAEAETYIARDALGSPAGANALEIYRRLLAENPEQPEALAGLSRIAGRYGELAQARQQQGHFEQALDMVNRGLALAPDNSTLQQQRDRLATALAEQRRQTERESVLAAAVKASLASHDFKSAASQLAAAREEFPHSQVLFGLSMDLDKALAEARPKVELIRISHQEMSALPEEQAPGLAADRVIHIGFSYRNFDDEAAVIQAILYDGSRSLQIVQVPVVVSGAEGVRFFRMEQPVSGFSEGGYHVDLLLDHQVLISERFSVKR